MPSIHFVERNDSIRRRETDRTHWESGDWVITPQRAQTLVGGNVYFHRGQKERSHFGGAITGFRVIAAPHPNAGRLIFEFTFDDACRDVPSPSSGWGNEQNYQP